MADTSRVLLYTPQDEFIEELNPDFIFVRFRTEQINGEHSLNISTATVLAKETRVLTNDATGTWHEYVVTGEDAEHASGKRAIGSYYAVWSMQHDLQLTTVSGSGSMPGTVTPVDASTALDAVLMGTSRWARGVVTVTATGGASMDQMSGWEALAVFAKVWGAEVEPTIAVDANGVISRAVNAYARLGSATALRRFDYSRDLISIKRKVDESPLCCRIIPLGKGEETAGGGYGRKITIADVNGGVEWLQNNDSAMLYRLPDGRGGYEYPTRYAENSDITDKQALKDWGLSVLDEWTLPKVTYEASVLQLAQAGMDIQGIALGDEVQCVDKAFCESGLRVTGRVVKLITNELDPTDIRVTIGNLSQGLPDLFTRVDKALVQTRTVALAASAYLDDILDNLNKEINASGGYWYLTDGQGTRTYDVAVSDPLVGAEASKVVEVKGGTIRIANSKTAQGAWEWKTVFAAGYISTSMIEAHSITADLIDASQLICPKVGNSLTEYSSIGDVSYQNIDMTGISFSSGGLTDRLFYGRTEEGDTTNQAIMAYGLPGAWGMFPMYLGLDNEFYLYGLPTLYEDQSVSPPLQSYMAPCVHVRDNFFEARSYRGKQIISAGNSGFYVRHAETNKSKVSLTDDGLFVWSYTNNLSFLTITPTGGRIANGGGAAGSGATAAKSIISWDAHGLHAANMNNFEQYQKLTLNSTYKLYMAKNYMGCATIWCEEYSLPAGNAWTTPISVQLDPDDFAQSEFIPMSGKTACMFGQCVTLSGGGLVVVRINNTGLLEVIRATTTTTAQNLWFTLTYPVC